MDKEYWSIKEIADQLNLSKQRVARCIKKNQIKEAHIEVVKGNHTLMYDAVAFSMIYDFFTAEKTESQNNGEPHCDVHHDVLYDALLKQLESKDKEIERLLEELAAERKLVQGAYQLLHDEQQLRLSADNRVLELEASENEDSWVKKFFKKLKKNA